MEETGRTMHTNTTIEKEGRKFSQDYYYDFFFFFHDVGGRVIDRLCDQATVTAISEAIDNIYSKFLHHTTVYIIYIRFLFACIRVWLIYVKTISKMYEGRMNFKQLYHRTDMQNHHFNCYHQHSCEQGKHRNNNNTNKLVRCPRDQQNEPTKLLLFFSVEDMGAFIHYIMVLHTTQGVPQYGMQVKIFIWDFSMFKY